LGLLADAFATQGACYSVLVRRHALDPVHATIAIIAFSCVSFVPAYGLAAYAGWVLTQLETAPAADLAFVGQKLDALIYD